MWDAWTLFNVHILPWGCLKCHKTGNEFDLPYDYSSLTFIKELILQKVKPNDLVTPPTESATSPTWWWTAWCSSGTGWRSRGTRPGSSHTRRSGFTQTRSSTPPTLSGRTDQGGAKWPKKQLLKMMNSLTRRFQRICSNHHRLRCYSGTQFNSKIMDSDLALELAGGSILTMPDVKSTGSWKKKPCFVHWLKFCSDWLAVHWLPKSVGNRKKGKFEHAWYFLHDTAFLSLSKGDLRHKV